MALLSHKRAFLAPRAYRQHFSICRQHSATSLQQSLAAKARAEVDISNAPAESLKNRVFIVVSKKLKRILKQKHKNSIRWRPNCKNGFSDCPIVTRVGKRNCAQRRQIALVSPMSYWSDASLANPHVGAGWHLAAQGFTTIATHRHAYFARAAAESP